MVENKNFRISIVGTTGSGKSTLAKKLSNKLNIPYFELDQFFWDKNWTPVSKEEFERRVRETASKDDWIIDGNYKVVRDIIWKNPTHIIWLNYSFTRTLFRSLNRSLKRIIRKEELFAGNIETFQKTFFSKDSILLYFFKSYHKKKKRYKKLLPKMQKQNIKIIEINSNKHYNNIIKNI